MRVLGSKLRRKQQRAIAALIEAPTIKEAAKSADVGEATLFRWFQNNEFQRAYRDARRRIVDQAIVRIQQATGEAVDALREIVSDENMPASARVSSAKTILDMAVKAVELNDLMSRVEALEERV